MQVVDYHRIFPYHLNDVEDNKYGLDVYCNKNVKKSTECFGTPKNFGNACYVDSQNNIPDSIKDVYNNVKFFPCKTN